MEPLPYQMSQFLDFFPRKLYIVQTLQEYRKNREEYARKGLLKDEDAFVGHSIELSTSYTCRD